MGSERASVMMRILPPVGWAEVATRRDLDELGEATRRDLQALELRIDAKFECLRSELLVTLGTWLFASQAAVIAAVTTIVALVR